MKVKRFFARDMRQAIKKIREELGPDAVILSNRKVKNGIEIVSAIDYDESLFLGFNDNDSHEAQPAPATETASAADKPATPSQPESKNQQPMEWLEDPMLQQMKDEMKSLRGILESQLSQLSQHDLQRRAPEKAAIFRRLEMLGMEGDIAHQLVTCLEDDIGLEEGWRHVLALLSHQINVTDDDILSRGGVVALIGPTGVGKTTSIAKLAARFCLRHGQREVALISTDSYRIGAQEQLMNFGRILDVPTYAVSDADELNTRLRDLADKRLVLIDTAGMSQRDVRLSEQMQTLEACSSHIRTHLVLAANTQTGTMHDVMRTFRQSKIEGCVLTKIDESSVIGGALSTMIRYRIPFSYVSDGQRVPEDMHPARAHSLVSRAVTLMQQQELLTEKYPAPIMHNRKTANAHV